MTPFKIYLCSIDTDTLSVLSAIHEEISCASLKKKMQTTTLKLLSADIKLKPRCDFTKPHRGFMKPQCDLLKPHCGFDFMRRLNNYFSAHIGFIANYGEENCARNERKSGYVKENKNRKVMLSFVISPIYSIFAVEILN